MHLKPPDPSSPPPPPTSSLLALSPVVVTLQEVKNNVNAWVLSIQPEMMKSFKMGTNDIEISWEHLQEILNLLHF